MNERWQGQVLSSDTGAGGTSVLRRTLRQVRAMRPDRGTLVDGFFILALTAVAFSTLSNTFTGSLYLLVGVVGGLVGILAAQVTRTLRAPYLVLILLGTVLLFVLGPVVALRQLPSPGSVREVAHQLVDGWKDLLTTLPPVEGTGPALVLCWFLGLLAGAVAAALAHRASAGHGTWSAPAAMVALLVATILIGSTGPTDLVRRGLLFGALLLAWTAVLGFRATEPVRNGVGVMWRLVSGAAIIGLGAAVALPLGGSLAAGEPRTVLRDHVTPPFDVGRYPSPLASFRQYTEPTSAAVKATRLYDKDLITVTGLAAGTRVRFATLDAFDGRTWGAANTGGSPGQVADTFERVSSTIANPLAEGVEEMVTATVTVGEGFSGVWVPTVGAVTELAFTSAAEDAAENWRYNLATSTAVLPAGLQPGDSYTISAALPDDDLEAALGSSADVTVDVPASLQAPAGDWGRDGGDDSLAQVLAVAAHLQKEGKYTDGKAPFQRYTAGHYSGRLTAFVAGDQMAGNDEQFAATMALMANQIGVPARVVLGAQLPQDGVVRGKDVHAWVEVRVADGTWRTLSTEQFMDRNNPPDPHPPSVTTDYSGAVVPPPAPVPPASTVGDPADGELEQKVSKRPEKDDEQNPVAGWIGDVLRYASVPVTLAALAAGSILGLKALRRRRRQRTGPANVRIVGGWREVMDRARDFGVEAPRPAATRSEQAAATGSATAVQMASVADVAIFAPVAPDDAIADHYWEGVGLAVKELGDAKSRWQRVRAALNPVTLSPTAWRRSRPAEASGPRPTTRGLASRREAVAP